MSVSSTESSSRADIKFREKDRALREDVHWLGELVGELVREQSGEAVFDLVEAARKLSIRRREGRQDSLPALQQLLSSLAPASAADFLRAYSTFFQMVNLAEKVHRIRRRRAYLKDVNRHQPYGILDTLQRLKTAGIGPERIESVLETLSIEPVFKANPTEATRRTLLLKQQNIARHLVQMLDPYMTPTEFDAAAGQIRMEMTTSWQTAERPAERRLSDEAEHVLFFVTDVLYRMIPPFYESLESAFAEIFGSVTRRIRLPVLVRFSTWVGGDMDGNPTVTAKSIRESLGRQRSLILDLYYKECGELARHLSQTEGRCEFLDEIRVRTEQYSGHFPKAAYTIPTRHSRMPYRVFLRLVQARLQATYDDAAFPYESPEEFTADIELITESLRANKGRNAGLFAVNRLLRRIETFGFHLATLDLRQNAIMHRRIVGEGLQEPDWELEDSAVRVKRIKHALERRESVVGSLSSDARRMLAVFQAIAHTRRRYGPRGIGSYIVRMARGPDDVLSVILLSKWGHLGPKVGAVPLDIAPLFETADELARASEIMESLLRDDVYREHLRTRGNQQTIVLGYSVANRDGDPVSARWNIHRAQRALGTTMERFGIELTIFHTRGSSMSRTGGRVHQALSALPADVSSNRLRITEQGEAINAKYGLRGIAMRSLEQLVSAQLWMRAAEPSTASVPAESEAILDAIAAASSDAYRRLVFESDEFESYFRQATPVDVIERVGLDATAETANASPIEGVHELAWQLAWTQTRCLLPDWFGLSSGIATATEAFGLEPIREMYRTWPFFSVLIRDIEVALSKADLMTAERYSELSGPLHEKFFTVIRDEYSASVDAVLALSGQATLLESSEILTRSIKLRNPYVDPMNFLQVDLLKRWRAGGRTDEALFQALSASVNGIMHAMQYVG